LISIIFEGLIGLQTYKMSSHFTGIVIKQLIDLATQSIVIVSKSLLSIVSDTLISNFEHEYSRLFILLNKIQNSEIESDESFQITEFLTGVSDGFAQLAKNLFRNQNLEYLSALKLQLSDLFVRLALIIYNENSHSSLAEGNTRRIELVESLGLLLHPISLAFELTSILKAQNSLISGKNELPHIRHLWYILVLFRIKESSNWSYYSNWLKFYQRIASSSPALIYYQLDGVTVSDGFIDKELSSDLILSSIISKNLLNNNEKIKLTKFAKFKNSGMGARMLYFTVTIQLCESLRFIFHCKAY
jgi:hypothetical protein